MDLAHPSAGRLFSDAVTSGFVQDISHSAKNVTRQISPATLPPSVVVDLSSGADGNSIVPRLGCNLPVST
eukprot:2726121-Pyramimonas_sp.AAC.1